MGNPTNVRSGDTFWAIDKETGKLCDRTGHCICTGVRGWAVWATDAEGNERVFLKHRFRFEVILEKV